MSDALTFAPLPCTAEGRRLLIVSRKFIESSWFSDAIRLGWDMDSLFRVVGHPLTVGKECVGLVVWLALNPRAAKLEKLTGDFAQARTACGEIEIYCRFHLLINEEIEPWWASSQVMGEPAA